MISDGYVQHPCKVVPYSGEKEDHLELCSVQRLLHQCRQLLSEERWVPMTATAGYRCYDNSWDAFFAILLPSKQFNDLFYL